MIRTALAAALTCALVTLAECPPSQGPTELGTIQAITHIDERRDSILLTNGEVYEANANATWNCHEGDTLWRSSFLKALYC